MSSNSKKTWLFLLGPAILLLNTFGAVFWTLSSLQLCDKGLAVMVALVCCCLVHKLALRLEAKGQLRYMQTLPSASAVKNVAYELDRFVRPSVEHRLNAEQKSTRSTEQDGE